MILEISTSVLGQISGQFKKPKKNTDGLFKIFFSSNRILPCGYISP